MNGHTILTPEDKLDALEDENRRQILIALYLQDQDDRGLEVSDFMDMHDPDRIRLYHIDLPKLSRYGLIDWDRETDEITEGPDFMRIESLLEVLYEHQDLFPVTWFDPK